MATLQQDDYLKILDMAAGLAQNGLAIFRWEASQRYPRYEWANDVIVARSKIARAELLGDEATFLSHGNNARLVEIARERIDAADETPFEVELTTADGATYWIESVVRALDPAPNGALRFVCATHVIERRKAHERFGKLLSAMADKAPAGIFIVRLRDANLLAPPVVYANPTFSRMSGYTQDELQAGALPQIFSDGTNRQLVSEYAEAVLRGESTIAAVRLHRKDETPFWAEVRAYPLEIPAIHCALIVRDITEQREAQDAMSLLAEGVAQASDFMIVTDDTAPSQDGPKILYVNRSFLEATGYDESELAGQPYTAIYSSSNPRALMESVRSSIEAGRPNYREVLARRSDGTEFWMEFVDRPFMTRHGRHLRLLVGRDITIRRRASNQLALLFAATEQATTPIVIYEQDESSALNVSYENEVAAERNHYHLLSLWDRGDADARAIRNRLERGELVVVTYTRTKYEAPTELVQLAARPIRNESRLEAILTQERVLSAGGAAGESARSRLIDLAAMLPSLERARDPQERLEMLRALLRSTFDASIELESGAGGDGVMIDERNRVARFSYRGQAARVEWPGPLEQLAVTALRFAIEAAIEI